MDNVRVLFWLLSTGVLCLAADFKKEYYTSAPKQDQSGNSTDAYCFQFTWVGPRIDTENKIKNKTCYDFVKGANNIPCVQPLVATNNSKPPDTEYIWKNYKKEEVACKLADVDVCVKYTHIYNHAVENITYMCAKVEIDGQGGIKDGCYTQYLNGREVEVCACRSNEGGMPCNKGNAQLVNHGVLLVVMFLLSMLKLMRIIR